MPLHLGPHQRVRTAEQALHGLQCLVPAGALGSFGEGQGRAGQGCCKSQHGIRFLATGTVLREGETVPARRARSSWAPGETRTAAGMCWARSRGRRDTRPLPQPGAAAAGGAEVREQQCRGNSPAALLGLRALEGLG